MLFIAISATNRGRAICPGSWKQTKRWLLRIQKHKHQNSQENIRESKQSSTGSGGATCFTRLLERGTLMESTCGDNL
jgi:hypothetical protein